MKGEYGVYLVTGKRQYRGHDPGTRFEAAIDAAVEARAITRGDIQLLERVIPSIDGRDLAFGSDWPPGREVPQATNEAPEGASLI